MLKNIDALFYNFMKIKFNNLLNYYFILKLIYL